MTEGIGEQSTLAVDGPSGSTPTPRSPGDLVLEAQRAKVFGALFTKPVLRRVGRYVVLDVLGQGGMGLVLKGYDDELDRQVAIKVLHAELGERHTERLRREAQALAKLSHPNVVQVYEVGELEGQTFVAMELCKGQTVRQWLEQEPRPGWKECVEVFIQLGQGLAAAHRRGLVHRDFKPGNAIIDEEGRARVLDFGLARRGEEGEEDDPPSLIKRKRTDEHEVVALDQSLTQTGTVLGTPAYMPPEQMDGDEADARSDQFSFCVALYEAVYGERPYEGESMMALMVSMRAGEVRPGPKRSDVPMALRKVLLRGLSVEPADRWMSMDALLEQLRRLVAPRRRRWMALGVTAGLLAVGGGLASVVYSQGKYEEARHLYERALAIWEEELDANHRKMASSLGKVADVAYSQGEYEDARDLYEQALTHHVMERGLIPDPNVAHPLTGLGASLRGLAKPDDALPHLEHALIIRTTHEVDPALLATTRFELARALWSAPTTAGRDRPRARILAGQARDAYASLGDATKTELAEVQAWLADHRLP